MLRHWLTLPWSFAHKRASRAPQEGTTVVFSLGNPIPCNGWPGTGFQARSHIVRVMRSPLAACVQRYSQRTTISDGWLAREDRPAGADRNELRRGNA